MDTHKAYILSKHVADLRNDKSIAMLDNKEQKNVNLTQRKILSKDLTSMHHAENTSPAGTVQPPSGNISYCI